jgi:hypothetical protein
MMTMAVVITGVAVVVVTTTMTMTMTECVPSDSIPVSLGLPGHLPIAA